MQLQTRIENLAARNRERMLEASKDDAVAYRNAVRAMKEVINYEIERVNRRQRNRRRQRKRVRRQRRRHRGESTDGVGGRSLVGDGHEGDNEGSGMESSRSATLSAVMAKVEEAGTKRDGKSDEEGSRSERNDSKDEKGGFLSLQKQKRWFKRAARTKRLSQLRRSCLATAEALMTAAVAAAAVGGDDAVGQHLSGAKKPANSESDVAELESVRRRRPRRGGSCGLKNVAHIP